MSYKNSDFCWWARDWDGTEVILSFDMHDEVFRTTLLPPGIDLLWGEDQVMRAIMPWNDLISLVVYQDREADKWFDIWVMNEFGVRESWTKLFRIGPLFGIKRPLSFWKKDVVLIEDEYGELVLYDLCRQEMKQLGFHARKGMLNVLVYKESLDSLTGGSTSGLEEQV
ncbi:F-box protein At3g07870-like [Actinidia eriantha]|uniref:F-box protein At3g07870-like n=1 Tax=Actinidia eriantha TaxID=165200 RepID=UPI00258444AE|nr:F-box protein At3g07870-like [Actinidia eriantha]